jgi:hypothetical protein
LVVPLPTRARSAAYGNSISPICYCVLQQVTFFRTPHTLGLLRADGVRPCCRAAEQRDELAASQIEMHSVPAACNGGIWSA